MSENKNGKVFLIVLFLIGVLLGYFIHEPIEAYLNENTYEEHIGHIFEEDNNTIALDTVKRHDYKYALGFYSSAAPNIYKGSKYQFKQNLLKEYKAEKYNDNGYLNLRFNISNEGAVWLYEYNEYTYDFEPTTFSEGLVEELVNLSLKKDNWYPFNEKNLNYYMHLTYRLENGQITEIIP